MQPTGVLDTAKATNPLKDLLKFGQSVWLDYIRRDLITGGELKRLIEEDGLRGMTSNPAIFEKAIAGSTDYADILESLRSRQDLDAKARYEIIAIRDIQDAADLLRPVYQESKRRDGYISLEVSPYLARDIQGTLEEARRLWKAVDRPNIMIKVPGTDEGVVAVQQLTAMGVNVNRVFNISFALASALGGAAGVMVGIYYNTVYPAMGGTAGLKGFAACIFGGLTSIPGAILGGLILGVVENLTVQFISSGYRDVVAFVVMVLVLVLRPQGLLGKKLRTV